MHGIQNIKFDSLIVCTRAPETIRQLVGVLGRQGKHFK
jgi:hypothetical protein